MWFWLIWLLIENWSAIFLLFPLTIKKIIDQYIYIYKLIIITIINKNIILKLQIQFNNILLYLTFYNSETKMDSMNVIIIIILN